jgi:hypothetical protein
MTSETQPTDYCTACGAYGDFERKPRKAWHEIEAAMVHIEYVVMTCSTCGVLLREPDNHPDDIATAEYTRWKRARE